jgi:hypothetical protein
VFGDGATDDRKDLGGGKAILREEPVGGAPILKLGPGSGKQTGHGVSSETEQRTQREGLRALGDAALIEGGAALGPELVEGGEETGRVFFKAGAGGASRRNARRALSSTIHSTVSPRENSMAWAMAEGKLMYHCSLVLRLMSCTLVGKPIIIGPFVVSSHITRYHNTGSITTENIKNAFYLVNSQCRGAGHGPALLDS